MKVIFRTDASLAIGTGHVMRCLTLARALRKKGYECLFICREHVGNLNALIQSEGFTLCSLSLGHKCDQELTHAHWLGATQEQDAEVCAPLLAQLQPGWLIVDHYALDARWESLLKPYYRHLMVIDDLADRPHQCDLLLDQTFGRDGADYRVLVPSRCQLLCGSDYALLRPEFAALRDLSLQRRTNPRLRHLLITLGGVDKDDATGQVLEALRGSLLPPDCRITVVMGSTAPWLSAVEIKALDMPWPTQVLVGVSKMAELMADSDLAIGAAGATSWERCCLGLPTITLILSDNQREVARNLRAVGVTELIDLSQSIGDRLPELLKSFIQDPDALSTISAAAARITNGHGALSTIQVMENGVEQAC
ncbi:pseudaminic acid biosynthesis-associated proteinPseG [Pseudomonas sp. MT-1]|uniref:UDP-2,4-diacetamido-2,4, 6-trideoxy-beta-L-altropyranose hydrolase n=1 Tax=Stutzerimonas stutzeri TaxID=316 RepID=UPI000535FE4C|nr:UDP-2,4-diacetamido-2,4,6-trideoxy-beta-L-altropyranose hydrolase [Stutzerimonas stutzeri]MCQ4283517.1 UDP-2,4-diacetamido-2,4,6-trideoxy-beta-L-altropyranose hydrolase [Stutzerimonas stutzeri]BAP80155.1 pseudaminic acid biosynthesis-associated proteinPseG [Pseudomonas sp. MT-1]